MELAFQRSIQARDRRSLLLSQYRRHWVNLGHLHPPESSSMAAQILRARYSSSLPKTERSLAGQAEPVPFLDSPARLKQSTKALRLPRLIMRIDSTSLTS